MNPFEYASPYKLDDAIALLDDTWGKTEILAGGTDLLTSLKQNIVAPERVVSLKNLGELRRIETSADEVAIGATVTLAELIEHPAIQKNFPCITQAIAGIASPQMLSMGTAGGDLCQRPRCWYFRQGFGLLGRQDGQALIPPGENRYHAIFGNDGPAYFVNPSSLAPGLIALDASLTIRGRDNNARNVKVVDFFRTPTTDDQREYHLAANEIVTRISIPIAGTANATYEIRPRQGLDWPLVTASVALDRGPTARNACIVLGHVAPTPWPVAEAASALDGKAIDARLAAEAGELAANNASPLSHNGYKVQLVRTAVKRAILAAAGIKES